MPRLATPAPVPFLELLLGPLYLEVWGLRGGGVTGGRRLPPKSGLWVRWWRSLGSSEGQWGFGLGVLFLAGPPSSQGPCFTTSVQPSHSSCTARIYLMSQSATCRVRWSGVVKLG